MWALPERLTALGEFADRAGFDLKVLAATPSPQQLCWLAMHQDYSEDWVGDCTPPPEDRAGELVVKNLLASDRGHYGPLEHPQITVAAHGFPHAVMQQLRTHRVGISFDCQSGRYTGERIIDASDGNRSIDDVFYFRPTGPYDSRQGQRYVYTSDMQEEDKQTCYELAYQYKVKRDAGMAEEHARECIPYAIRQDFVMSVNLRSGLHLLDLRLKPDAQAECQAFAYLLLEQMRQWAPEIVEWYVEKRLWRGRLAP